MACATENVTNSTMESIVYLFNTTFPMFLNMGLLFPFTKPLLTSYFCCNLSPTQFVSANKTGKWLRADSHMVVFPASYFEIF